MHEQHVAMPAISIGTRNVGVECPVYVIAELSANHHQDFEQAVQLIRAAKDAGADAVKLQTYTPDTITMRSDREYFRVGGGTLWDGKTLYELYGEAYTPWEWQPKLKQVAEGSWGWIFFLLLSMKPRWIFSNRCMCRHTKLHRLSWWIFRLFKKWPGQGSR